MSKRSLLSACHSWLTTLVCCLLALLTAGEPSNPFHLVVQRLLAEPVSESERTQDEEGEAGKAADSALAGRRSFRKRSGSLPGHHRQVFLSLRTDSFHPHHSSASAASWAGELAYRNGVGAPLRC